MRLESVRSLADAVRMRAVRNTCRNFMTRDTSRVSVARQVRWYYGTYLPRFRAGVTKAWLMKTTSGLAVGWGYLNYDGENAWVTGGLLRSFRGMRLGKRIFRHLTNMSRVCGWEPWLEVYAWNEAGLATYRSLGYEEVFRRGEGRKEVITMRCPVYG